MPCENSSYVKAFLTQETLTQVKLSFSEELALNFDEFK